MGPKSSAKCPCKRKAERDLRCLEKTEAAVPVMQLQTKEGSEPPGTGNDKEGVSPRTS